MQISFQVSRQAAILGGYNQCGLVTVDVDTSTLSQADRQLLAAAITESGRVASNYPSADAPTVDGLLAILRAKAAADAAEAAAEVAEADAEVAAVNARAAENLRNRELITAWDRIYAATGAPFPHGLEKVLSKARGREAEIDAWHSPEWAAWQAEIDEENARRDEAAQAERAAEEAAHKAKEAELAAAKEAADAAKAERVAKLREWAAVHGSELTKARLAEGYGCWYSAAVADVADTVRARFTAAGFAESPDDEGRAEPRKCPTLKEIVALRKARTVAAEITEWPTSVSLCRVEYDQDDDVDSDEELGDAVYATEIRVKVDIWGETEKLWFRAE